MYETISLYRVISFNKAMGPWRATRCLAQEDAVNAGLGNIDEWGKFWAVVPGNIQRAELPVRVLLAALGQAGLELQQAA